MNLDAWILGDEDPGRAKRLVIGYAVGVALILGAGGSLAAMRAEPPPPAEDEVIDVKLAASVEAPPPKSPPPPVVEAPRAPPPGPAPRKAIVAPTAVPTEAPPESDKTPPPRSGTDEYADGKGGVVGGVAGGTGTGTVAVAAAPPPPPPPAPAPPPLPPPKAQGPISLPENATPAVALSTPAPQYPAGAKADGITATVVVRFDIGEGGEVTNVVIVRGHPLFDAAVLAAVRTWRYRPAVFEGRPLAVTKSVRIPFTIKM